MSRSQETMTRKPGEYNIFANIWANFAKIRWRVYQGMGQTD